MKEIFDFIFQLNVRAELLDLYSCDSIIVYLSGLWIILIDDFHWKTRMLPMREKNLNRQ